jgi:acetate---CoA ligase (ADP-forming)
MSSCDPSGSRLRELVRLAPLTAADVHEMLSEVRGGALPDGLRGQPAVDRDALARIIVSVGELMLIYRR